MDLSKNLLLFIHFLNFFFPFKNFNNTIKTFKNNKNNNYINQLLRLTLLKHTHTLKNNNNKRQYQPPSPGNKHLYNTPDGGPNGNSQGKGAVSYCHKDLHTRGCRDPRSISFLRKCSLTKSYLASVKFIEAFFHFLLNFFLLFVLFSHSFSLVSSVSLSYDSIPIAEKMGLRGGHLSTMFLCTLKTPYKTPGLEKILRKHGLVKILVISPV